MSAEDQNGKHPSATPIFINREQLSARWGLSISSIKRMEKSGVLVATRFGPRTVRFSLAHIEDIEKQRASQAGIPDSRAQVWADPSASADKE